MSNISHVTVSLSRLALAKAIKTPDVGEQDAEPWTNSIIFHQPHIDAQMRNSILNPQSMQQSRRKNERHGNQKQPLLNQRQPPVQQHHHHSGRPVSATHMSRVRSDEMRLAAPSPPTQQQNRTSYFSPQPQPQLQLQKIPSSQSTSSGGGSSLSSGKKIVTSHSHRKIVPSDDDDDDDDDDDEDEANDDDNEPSQTNNHKTHASKTTTMILSPLPGAIVKNGKSASRIPQPSDDEESDQKDDITDDSEDEDEQQEKEDKQMYARRMSTLRQLERGPSAHRRTRSTGDMMMLPPVETFMEPATRTVEGNTLGSIEQWRVTVMEADGISTPTSSASMQSHFRKDPSEGEQETGDLLEESVVHSNTPSVAAAAAVAVAAAAAPNILPCQQTPMPGNRSRRSTLGEIDMFYYQQQQQQLYNMQLQQAMQMQQAQQMAQFQQYQAMQMQQQQQQQQQAQQYRKANNRKSVSAMDLLIQMEQEKAANRKTNKKQLPDPSKATLADGLLSRVPEPGQHNMNFQHYLMKQQMARASKNDYHLRQNGEASSRMNNRQSQMIRSESSPIPTLSTSINQAYLIPPYQQQQMIMPPQIMPSRSSQHLNSSSNHGNSKRQSTYSMSALK